MNSTGTSFLREASFKNYLINEWSLLNLGTSFLREPPKLSSFLSEASLAYLILEWSLLFLTGTSFLREAFYFFNLTHSWEKPSFSYLILERSLLFLTLFLREAFFFLPHSWEKPPAWWGSVTCRWSWWQPGVRSSCLIIQHQPLATSNTIKHIIHLHVMQQTIARTSTSCSNISQRQKHTYTIPYATSSTTINNTFLKDIIKGDLQYFLVTPH